MSLFTRLLFQNKNVIKLNLNNTSWEPLPVVIDQQEWESHATQGFVVPYNRVIADPAAVFEKFELGWNSFSKRN